MRASAKESRGASWGLFHTHVFPQISAGIIFQNGTAAGKLQALIIPQTPSGLRYVNNSLSGNSEFTV
tara:strand:- start:33 stop:233 length:201 start_codon:yes stop_codon:yes gene_type:complete